MESRRTTSLALRVGARIGIAVAVAGCTPTIQARGTKYEVSEEETKIASRIEGNADPTLFPPEIKTLCDYWRVCAGGGVCLDKRPVSGSPGFQSWLEAKREEACKGQATVAVAPNASSEGADDGRQANAEAWHAQWRKTAHETSERETQDQRCDAKRLAQLQARINERSRIRNVVHATEGLVLVAHRIVALSNDAKGTEFSFNSGIAGGTHVFVLGYEPPSLSVFNAHGDPATASSSYAFHWPEFPDDEVSVHYDAELRTKRLRLSASRLIQANSGEALTIRAQGKGCALIAVYREL